MMINFISAIAGGVELKTENNDVVAYWASNAADLASFIKELGFATNCYFSSSMDFADEEGFDSYDGARKLFDEACELAGV